MDALETWRLRQLQEANRWLMRLATDRAPDIEVWKDGTGKVAGQWTSLLMRRIASARPSKFIFRGRVCPPCVLLDQAQQQRQHSKPVQVDNGSGVRQQGTRLVTGQVFHSNLTDRHASGSVLSGKAFFMPVTTFFRRNVA
jgi:hypothetical protein